MTTVLDVCHECEEWCDPDGKHTVSGLNCDHKKYTYWPENFGKEEEYTEVPGRELTKEELAEVYSQEYAEKVTV